MSSDVTAVGGQPLADWAFGLALIGEGLASYAAFGYVNLLKSYTIGSSATQEARMGSTNQDPAKFRQYRERLKARGMRRIQLWVPDTTLPRFQAELRRQLALIESGDDDRETLGFIERSADWDD